MRLQGGGDDCLAGVQALRGLGHADGAACVEDVEGFHGVGMGGWMRQPEMRFLVFRLPLGFRGWVVNAWLALYCAWGYLAIKVCDGIS